MRTIHTLKKPPAQAFAGQVLPTKLAEESALVLMFCFQGTSYVHHRQQHEN